MKSNFQFIESEWPQVYHEAKNAEEHVHKQPRYAGLLCRSALELAVNWMYMNDPDLEYPYDKTLASLLHQEQFRNELKTTQFQELNFIRKVGNLAAHGKNISEKQSFSSLIYLHKFCVFLSKFYSTEDPEISAFDESLLQTGKEKDKTITELQNQIEVLANQVKVAREKQLKLEEKAQENELLRTNLLKDEQKVKERKAQRIDEIGQAQLTPEIISEADTRKNYIDLLLQEAGWEPNAPGVSEFEVTGMPMATNPSGIGYVDYVLWGDDGLPLAVVEAKKTLLSAEKGKRQAEEYADCLEQMYGQRPIIFYTNGFEHFIWDDTFYPPRQVHGFYTKSELQQLINRRTDRLDIRTREVNHKTVERPYQIEGIGRVMDAFVTQNSKNELKGKARKALMVMATGSGKTRTAAAIVDVLTKCNWVKRVLFLADRNALVTQAKNAFNEHLPHLSAIDLTKEKENDSTRLVFSTYPTIMNRIDGVRSGDERFYGVGHFDLVIIDEAHRSVYVKYKAIFDYFDSLLIGLTATPKTEVDKNTYSLFELEDNVPTFAYELEQAVQDGFLVPPKAMSVPVKFPRKGVKYAELSEKEKQEWEEKFGDPEQSGIVEIDRAALNNWLFNTDTVDKVLTYLMKNGIKVGGEHVGKTIIFAISHKHALFIEERFNTIYPEFSGKFLRVIDNYEPRAQNLLETFCLKDEDKDPIIAVSVDMMDTGVDAPRVVNLVFFKPVYSYTKFWQMIGRGTRLCPELFGSEKDKEYFSIFDFCENLEFFNENPEGIEGSVSLPLSTQIFRLKFEITQVISNILDADAELIEIKETYLNQLNHLINHLDRRRFAVKMAMRFVEEYSARRRWDNLNKEDETNITDHLSHLPDVTEGGEESAKRFDILMLNMALYYLLEDPRWQVNVSKLIRIGNALLKKVNIPVIAKQEKLIKEFIREEFWKIANVKRIEQIRISIRELVKFLDKESASDVYTTFEDHLDEANIKEFDLVKSYQSAKAYRERVEAFIRKNRNHLTIDKLYRNLPLTPADVKQLEEFLFDGDQRGTKEELEKELKGQSLGAFIRSIIGLDMTAIQKQFADFLRQGSYSPNQIRFINVIVDYLAKNGTLNKELLFEPPYTDIHQDGLFGVFEDGDVRKVISIVDTINGNANVG